MSMESTNDELMVSIRCITYNHESYIRQCLEGFVMQKTNFRFEAIVHDDASTDGTADIIREYAEKYPGIIKPIFEIENQYSKHDGSISRIMHEHMRGKYIAMCEGDDYWIDSLKLQKQVDFLEINKDFFLVFSNRFIENSKGVFAEINDTNFTSNELLGGFVIGIQTICYRNIYISQVEGVNGDILIPYICSLHGKLYCLPDVTAVYRMTGKGVATSRTKEESLKTSLKDMFLFHKAFDFPSKSLLLKAQMRYIFIDIVSKLKDGNVHVCSGFEELKTYHSSIYYNKICALYYLVFFFIQTVKRKIVKWIK